MDSPAPLHSSLASMSLSTARGGGAGLLQDEDLTLTLGDDDEDEDSFEQEDRDDDAPPRRDASSSKSTGVDVGVRSGPGSDVVFGGSMGVVSAAAGYGDPTKTTTTTTASDEQPATGTTANSRAAAVPQTYIVDEDDDVDLEGESAKDYSAEEKKRILDLRDERDGLRGMNHVLGGLIGGLKEMEVKLQVSLSKSDIFGPCCADGNRSLASTDSWRQRLDGARFARLVFAHRCTSRTYSSSAARHAMGWRDACKFFPSSPSKSSCQRSRCYKLFRCVFLILTRNDSFFLHVTLPPSHSYSRPLFLG